MKIQAKQIGIAVIASCVLFAAMPTHTFAADDSTDVSITDTNFRYSTPDSANYQDEFYLESDLVQPDFMVVGMQYNDKGMFGYWITPVNQMAGGLGILYLDTVTTMLHKTELQVGDLLRVEGNFACAAIRPTYYIFSNAALSDATLHYLGYGPDLLGESFHQVIRRQLVISPENDAVQRNEIQTKHTLYGVPLVMGDTDASGDVGLVDCVRMTKYLHGKAHLCDYSAIVSDINHDGEIDIFDLGLLKNKLVNNHTQTASVNLSASYAAQPVQTVDIDEQTVLGQTKFALDLLRESAESGKNSLVSPYSVSQALGMTANGAASNTLQEMETVLGGSMETLNPAFYTLRTRDTKDAKCVTANSIWMKDKYIQEHPVSKAFLQTNADYYGADAFAAPFDETTLADINGWVNDKTDQMIPSIIEEIPNDAVMYLVNAVAFDAEWEQPYSTDQESKFTAADGTEQTVKMLCRDDFGRPYYQDEHAIGFRQDYKGGAYYFAAFLPEQGMTPEAYLDTLTAESLQKMLSNPASGKIYSEIPEFSYDYSIKLKDPLSAMGMPSAFVEGEGSDFSRMAEDGEDNLFIKDVFHKTHIEVTKMGTRAGASTAVEMWAESVPIYVRLNRPFLYMIADSETNLPVFIGIVNSVQ